jgi:hypothetical protein
MRRRARSQNINYARKHRRPFLCTILLHGVFALLWSKLMRKNPNPDLSAGCFLLSGKTALPCGDKDLQILSSGVFYMCVAEVLKHYFPILGAG